MNHTRSHRWIAFALLVASAIATSATTQAQTVHVVAANGSGDFLQVQAAVDAATSGDVILVRPDPDRYTETLIDGKALTLVGDGSVRPGLDRVRIRNLPAGESVVLRSLDIAGGSGMDVFWQPLNFDGLDLTDNIGTVWLQDLVIAGAVGIDSFGSLAEGRLGLVADDNDGIVLVDCGVSGGQGFLSVGGTPYPGGDAAEVIYSRLAIYGSTFIGGEGGIGGASSLTFGEQGGMGLECITSIAFLSGSALTGGDTGAFGPVSPEPSASGLFVRDGSLVNHVDTTFEAGQGNAPVGADIGSSGAPSTVIDLDDDHRRIGMRGLLRETEQSAARYSGQPGDLVLLQASFAPAWTLMPSLKGVQQLATVTAQVFLGVAGPAGQVLLPFNAPMLPVGVDALTVYAQPVLAETGGELRLGAPTCTVVVDDSL